MSYTHTVHINMCVLILSDQWYLHLYYGDCDFCLCYTETYNSRI